MNLRKLFTLISMSRLQCSLVLITIFAALTPVRSDPFGSGINTFQIDFVNIGNSGNAPQSPTNRSHSLSGGDGYGSVLYQYRISTHEISQEQIDRAKASGLSNVLAGRYLGSQPAGQISWYGAAAFVNWLNESTGRPAAYDLVFNNGIWSMRLWSSAVAWQEGGINLFRHKDAHYFLPSENEWYKAAYYNPAGFNYFLYPTGSDTAPIAVMNGTTTNTAVYDHATNLPAAVTNVGGLSPYGTMGQGGNSYEVVETAYDGVNNSASEVRTMRGGDYENSQTALRSSYRTDTQPSVRESVAGFRVASVLSGPVAVLTVEKTTNLSGQWQFDREINFGPMTNTNEFYRLKIHTVEVE